METPVKVFSRLFLVDKTFIYENPYEGVWGVLGNSSYKPFYNDFSPLEIQIHALPIFHEYKKQQGKFEKAWLQIF